MDMHYYEDFKEMLECLNEKLIAVDAKIEIRAIGGFAIMCNSMVLNFDARNASVDIDAYNEYEDNIKTLIQEVATEFDVNDDWLNTDWRDDYTMKHHSEDGIIIGLNGWAWIPSMDIILSNIKVFYANVEGLFAMKLRSVNERLEQQEEPRLNDVTDLISILALFEEENLSIVKNELIQDLLVHFGWAKDYLMGIMNNDS